MRRATCLTKKETQHKRRGAANNPKHAALLKSCREVSREPNLLSDMICVNGTIGAQWELRRALARTDQRFRHRSYALRAHAGHYGAACRVSGRPFQAAFRTSTGSIRSASRYSTRNGRSIEFSPGLLRRDCRQVARNSHCRPQACGGSGRPSTRRMVLTRPRLSTPLPAR